MVLENINFNRKHMRYFKQLDLVEHTEKSSVHYKQPIGNMYIFLSVSNLLHGAGTYILSEQMYSNSVKGKIMSSTFDCDPLLIRVCVDVKHTADPSHRTGSRAFNFCTFRNAVRYISDVIWVGFHARVYNLPPCYAVSRIL